MEIITGPLKNYLMEIVLKRSRIVVYINQIDVN